MTESIFNSAFEMELRVLLLMSATKKKAYSIERIVSLDFIICYAGFFQLPYQAIDAFSHVCIPADDVNVSVGNCFSQHVLLPPKVWKGTCC